LEASLSELFDYVMENVNAVSGAPIISKTKASHWFYLISGFTEKRKQSRVNTIHLELINCDKAKNSNAVISRD